MSVQNTPISRDITDSTEKINHIFSQSFDLCLRNSVIKNTTCAFVSLDGLCDGLKIAQTVIKPLLELTEKGKLTDDDIKSAYCGNDMKKLFFIEDITSSLLLGNLIFLADGLDFAYSFGVQGFAKKAVDEPQTEQNEKGSQEGFTDNAKDNISLLRRRLRTPELVIEQLTLGALSNTPVYICHLKNRTDGKMLEKIKAKLKSTKLDTVLGSGYLRPFLEKQSPSFFSGTGITERPDMLAAKLSEGRIGVIVDGTPFAVIVPYLLSDYFHSLDDYLSGPFYALFIRILRIICFFIAVSLPGVFVAICLFHPEILPSAVMYDIAAEEAQTPFPLMAEAFAIHLIYEIVREAGLRMPRAIGHAVSIVGALVIGDAAVTAGLIAAPMLIIVALTTVCSSVNSRLHEPVTIIRLIFIAVGGTMGLYGIFIGLGLMLADICSTDEYGVPFSVPFSPFVLSAQRDNVLRVKWQKLGKKHEDIRELEF